MSSKLKLLQDRLQHLVDYIKPFLPLVNCHMTSYITDNLWSNMVPIDIRQEIQSSVDIETAIKLFFEHNISRSIDPHQSDGYRNYMKLLQECDKYTLDQMPEIFLSPTELKEKLKEFGCAVAENPDLSIKEFMSAKKSYEVEIVANIVACLCRRMFSDSSMAVIDAGDGKGYLSSRLALQYHLKVLGIDANEINTVGATKRNSKLKKAWNGLTRRAEDIKNGIIPPRRGRTKTTLGEQKTVEMNSEDYKTTTEFVTSSTKFVELIQSSFSNENISGICLSGLHTCGNLAPTCLTVFACNPDIRSVLNIGCCYHLLDELFKKDEPFSSKKFACAEISAGFPMSEFLCKQKFFFGRNARMLASQSIPRTVNKGWDPSDNRVLFYRAVLEILLKKYNKNKNEAVRCGKIKKFTDFTDYAVQCIKKTNVNVDMDKNELEQFMLDHEFHERYLNLFYLIRMSFAPILEAIILLDRLLFLHEKSIETSYIVKLFDPVVSPRCYGIIATKDIYD